MRMIVKNDDTRQDRIFYSKNANRLSFSYPILIIILAKRLIVNLPPALSHPLTQLTPSIPPSIPTYALTTPSPHYITPPSI